MKETTFIEQNKAKWQRFEKLKKDGSSDPDELSNLFVEITDDLSYARTFYPRRSVRVYLNNLAQSVFNSLYKLKKDPFGNFIKFWKIGLPIEMYRARKHLLASFIVFGISVLIGVVSTWDDIQFANVILGDGYVATTEDFIAEGDPMGIYKQQDEFPMFLRIFINNIRVAFITFALGVLFCVGTGFILISNGVMLGTFQSFFYFKEFTVGKGLFMASVLTIWIHGTFEILAIILSGGAGFVAGMSLIYPGTYTRMQSFQIGMKRGLKMMLGVTPFIFFAAVLEGYVTRHTEMAGFTKWAIIILSFSIFVFYFVIYPFIVYKKYEKEFASEPEPVYRANRKVELYKIKQTNEVVADAFIIFKDIYSKSSKYIWGLILPLHLIVGYFVFMSNADEMNYYNLDIIDIFNTMITGNGDIIYFFSIALLFSLSMAMPIRSLFYYDHHLAHDSATQKLKKYLISTLVFFPFVLIILSVNFLYNEVNYVVFLAVLPLIVYLPIGINLSTQKGFDKLTNTFQSFFKQFGNAVILMVTCVLILGGIFALLNSLLFLVIDTLIEWHTITVIEDYSLFINFFYSVLYFTFLHHFFIFLSLIYGLSYYVNSEIQESHSLFKKLEKFGRVSKTHENYNHHEK